MTLYDFVCLFLVKSLLLNVSIQSIHNRMLGSTLHIDGYQILPNFLNAASLTKLSVYASVFATASTPVRKNVFAKSNNVFTIFKQLENQLNLQGIECKMTNYCFYLEKTTDKNWPLQIHQDINFPAYLNLSDSEQEKWLQQGFWVRVNLDNNNSKTGALKVIPKSHLLGKNAAIEKSNCIYLPANKGDVILFSPLTYHGSDKMKQQSTRRIFQCFFLIKAHKNSPSPIKKERP